MHCVFWDFMNAAFGNGNLALGTFGHWPAYVMIYRPTCLIALSGDRVIFRKISNFLVFRDGILIYKIANYTLPKFVYLPVKVHKPIKNASKNK